MFECNLNQLNFWVIFFLGGIVCIAVFEFFQFIIMSALGVRGLTKELKRKNDINERNERIEPKL